MTPEEFKQLENLLEKFRTYLGHDYCVAPNQIQDGFLIALYDKKGDRVVDDVYFSLETTAARVMQKMKAHEKTK